MIPPAVSTRSLVKGQSVTIHKGGQANHNPVYACKRQSKATEVASAQSAQYNKRQSEATEVANAQSTQYNKRQSEAT